MTTSIITPQIAEFARSVRAALGDLPADERDELTDGLEADLAEAYAEDSAGSRGARELPDPVEYATELRNAAGLPKVETDDHGMVASLALTARRARGDVAAAITGNATLSAVADFLSSIRPVWWVARAVLAAWLVAIFFGNGAQFGIHGVMWVVLVAFVVVSVQWGRDRWGFPGLTGLVVVGNVVAIITIPLLYSAGWWGAQSIGAEYVDAGFSNTRGLTANGEAVRNVFAYDADGKPLADVQLFDQDGRPLEALLDPMTDECLDQECRVGYRQDGTAPQAARLVTGASTFNVFPLSVIATTFDDIGVRAVDPTATAEAPAAPFAQVPAVDRLEPTDGGDKVAADND